MHIKSVLIADEIEVECESALKAAGLQVVKRTKLPEKELSEELKNHDAIIVRSATKVTRSLISSVAGKLKLIGRAGTGVDNIDVQAATEHGVVVMNTPSGNSQSAAELTSTLILSLCRNVPAAAASMKANRWDRKLYMGTEVNQKTLAIIGLGRIGQIVTQHMQAFGMDVVGYDPLVTPEAAAKFGVRWLPLNQIWPIADFVTVHVPLIPQTKNMIGRETFPLMKRGVRIVNVARGGIVDEDALFEALESGQCGGAALDVFIEEPPKCKRLIDHPSVICTPHLGASTIEAQNRVAVEVADNIVALNKGQLLGAINAPHLAAFMQPPGHCQLAHTTVKLARLLNDLSSEHKHIKLICPQNTAKPLQNALSAAALTVILSSAGKQQNVNLINAHFLAEQNGFKVEVQEGINQELTMSTDTLSLSGYRDAKGTVITAINGKLQQPINASGVLAVCLTASPSSELKPALKTLICSETVLNNNGHVLQFDNLNEQDETALPQQFSVVRFTSNTCKVL